MQTEADDPKHRRIGLRIDSRINHAVLAYVRSENVPSAAVVDMGVMEHRWDAAWSRGERGVQGTVSGLCHQAGLQVRDDVIS